MMDWETNHLSGGLAREVPQGEHGLVLEHQHHGVAEYISVRIASIGE